MFKCSECSEEYQIKPDYCKCGNDIFIEIEPPKQEKTSYKEFAIPVISLQKIFPIAFFIFCIILAILPWTMTQTPQKSSPIQKQPAQTVKNIPSIEQLWQEPKIAEPVHMPKPTPQQVPLEADVTIPQKQKVTPTPLPQKPKEQKIEKKQPKPSIQKNVAVPANSQRQVKLPQPKTQPNGQNVSTEIKKMDAREFLNYKGAVRNALLARLNLAAVKGEGECLIEFSVDNSGKLLNRRFISQSSNKSVNDEVYYMLMRLPRFKKPPQYYNGEKIRFKIYLNNGYYEISYVN